MKKGISLLVLAALIAVSAGDAAGIKESRSCHSTQARATCKPLAGGACKACTTCSACKHCSKEGGTCSVCKKKKK